MNTLKKTLNNMEKKKSAVWFAACLPLLCPHAHAAELVLQGSGQRASEMLLNAAAPLGAEPVFYEALVFTSPSELPAQEQLKNRLLLDIERAFGRQHPLHQLLSKQTPTGRVLLPSQFPQRMAVDPKIDPVLKPDQQLRLMTRPTALMVLTSRGALCRLPYAGARESIDYIAACLPNINRNNAQVRLVQPDGSTEAFALSHWKRSKHSLPMPGAWLWVDTAEPAGKRLPADFNTRMAQWLAFQGPGLALADADTLNRAGAVTLQGLALAKPQTLPGSPGVYESRDLPVTSNDFGMTGLLQTPTARMRKEGNFTYTQTRVSPYVRYNVIFQPFEWLQTGFRYNDITNRGAADQPALDKNIDVKVRLFKETTYTPELALGIQDLGGTGLFGGEYLVGSKRHGDFDFSAGLGWGYTGKAGSYSNPLSVVSDKFKTRPNAFESGDFGGTFSFSTFFRGPVTPFAGVQYHTPIDKLILKAELDGNNYQSEPQGNRFEQKSRFNFGAVYRLNNYVDLMAGLERGNQAQIGIAVNVDLLGPQLPKIRDPLLVPVKEKVDSAPANWQKVADRIAQQTEWRVGKIEKAGDDLNVYLAEQAGFYYGPQLDRAVALLNEEAPAEVDDFNIVYTTRGLPMAVQRVDRDEFVREQTQWLPPGERETLVTSLSPAEIPRKAETVFEQPLPLYTASLSPYYSQTLGGVRGLLFYQAGAVADLKLNLGERTWVNSFLKFRMLDNYASYEEFPSPSTLPRTRTFLKEFNTTSRFNVSVLQANHMERLSENSFGLVYGGLMEYAFGGAGAEYLYRPYQSRLALGVDVNEVKLRDFDQKFSFRDYSAKTGHITAYWDTGFQDVLATLKVGQYVGGDKGVTVNLQRVFNNGVAMGAYATKTNVSAKDFGEGSFDKGIFVNVPFDYLLPKSTSGVVNFAWSPLTRDGGVLLQRSQQLYNLTETRGRRALYVEPVR